MKPVKLSDIAEALDTNLMEGSFYLNTSTGETMLLTSSLERFLEEHFVLLSEPTGDIEALKKLAKEELLGWEMGIFNEVIEAGVDALCHIEPLSSREQYEIMEEYIDGIEDERVRNLLYVAIEGRGAFRRFKDSLAAIGRLSDYFEFHDRVMQDKAREWCEDGGYTYTV